MATIKSIHAYEEIDSRGYPTLAGNLVLDSGWWVSASIPAGTSIGKYEAMELRDNDKTRFDGMGVTTAASYVNDLLAPRLVGVSPQKQQDIDYWLIKADGSKNKSRLGANTTLLISTLVAKAAALELGMRDFQYLNQLYGTLFQTKIPLEKIPSPIFNIVNGGRHANNNLEFQEFQIIPSSSYSFSKAYQMGVEIYHELKRTLAYRNANISVGEEGGFTPNFSTNLDAIEVINETLVQKNLKSGIDIFFGIDFASSLYYKDDRYVIKDKPHPLKKEEYLEFLVHLTTLYSFLIFEDPFQEDDWESWKKLHDKISDQIYMVADDLVTTNKERLERAIKEQCCSTILIKPTQIGTITEALEVVDMARKNNFNYIVSHRSGETEDAFIADFAVAIQCDFVKFGAPSRGERVVKYNRLWQIEREELSRS